MKTMKKQTKKQMALVAKFLGLHAYAAAGILDNLSVRFDED